MHVMNRLKRIAVVLIIALPMATVMTLASASASASAVTPKPVSISTGETSHATPGLYNCAKSATCDIQNAHLAFTNYSAVCKEQDCNFVAAADWEKVVLGLDPTNSILKSEYTSDGQAFNGGPSMTGLWPYWRTTGIDGALLTKASPYADGRASVQNGVRDFGGLIAELALKNNAYIGTGQYSSGVAILIVDGFDPKGPLVVYIAKTIQMTWAQWSVEARGMWGLAASISTPTQTPPPTRTTTATVTFNANSGSGSMTSETEDLNTATALSPNTFVYAGHTFNAWNTSPTGSGTSYANDATYSFTTSVTLYAQWTSITTPFTGQASSNWSGYVLPTSTPLTGASGQFTVPTLNCTTTPDGVTGTWVGIGGVGGNSGALLQTGVIENCVDGVQQNSGFWEIVPATPNQSETYTDFPVNAGDTMIATIEYENGQWATVLEDVNTGLSGVFVAGANWVVLTTSTGTVVGGVQGNASGYAYSGGYSAEWIQEDVTQASTGSLFPFPDYGSVTFTGLKVLPAGSSLPNSDAVEIQNSAGAVISVPGPYGGSSGFTVTYTGA